MMRLLRGAFVIARRDFTATVLSKAFLFFLLGPLFPLLLGGVFGGIGARVANQAERPVVAFVGMESDFTWLQAARERLVDAVGDKDVVHLVYFPPERDLAAQKKRLLASTSPPVRAVLSGWSGDLQLTGSVEKGDETVRQLEFIIRNGATPQFSAPPLDIKPVRAVPASLTTDRAVTGQISQMLLFFLTLLLSGMVMSQLIEEKSNKIIEVIAAAVPIDAMFLGKLFAMLAASVVGILVWTAVGAVVIEWLVPGGVRSLPPPAIGWPLFLALGIVYFAMNYLLLGSVFLTIGAQASTAREVQTLSMPVTFAQVVIFGFAATAVGAGDSPEGITAAVFPLSSPLAMVARAAERTELWPHLAAIIWQALWVALILKLGAKLFRRSVLKSGPVRPWWKLKRA
jgi:ABC-2 type transport system permease protein